MIFPLTLTQAQVTRKGKRILGPIDLVVPAGGITCVIGPNGAGKTTLLRALHGLDRLEAGQLTWAVDTESARQSQSFVFQAPALLRRSVAENLAYPLLLRGMSRQNARAKAKEAAAQADLTPHLDQPASSLSGGEQQKLALARALITAPKAVFLDEPCASLDGAATRAIESSLTQACQAGTTVIMSTHAMGQARRLAHRILFIHKGRILEHAPAQDFFTSPKTPQAHAYINGDILL